MKMIFAAVALTGTVLAAGTALANHANDSVHSVREHQSSEFRDVQKGQFLGGAAAYARQESMSSPNAVYVDGQYRGADPDPQIRSSLLRETPAAW